MPGKPSGAAECLSSEVGAIPHCVEVLRSAHGLLDTTASFNSYLPLRKHACHQRQVRTHSLSAHGYESGFLSFVFSEKELSQLLQNPLCCDAVRTVSLVMPGVACRCASPIHLHNQFRRYHNHWIHWKWWSSYHSGHDQWSACHKDWQFCLREQINAHGHFNSK